MVIDMTRQRRLRRAWGFSIVMFFLCAISFAVAPGHVYDLPELALLSNALIWGMYSVAICGELERLSIKQEAPMKKT